MHSSVALMAVTMLCVIPHADAYIGWRSFHKTSSVDPQPLELAAGTTQVRELAAGETGRFSVVVAAGEVVLVEIDQGGLDLRVVRRPPGGEPVTSDSLLSRDEREIVLIAGVVPGRHVIELRSDEFTDTVATIRIRTSILDPVRQAAEITAYRAMMIGAQFAVHTTNAAAQRALVSYREAAEIWNRLGNARNAAWANYSIAGLEYFRLYDWLAAAAAAERAAAGYEDVGDQALVAGTQHLRATAFVEAATVAKKDSTGQNAAMLFQTADRLFAEVLELQQRVDLPYRQAVTINDMGLSALYQGRWDDAQRRWSEAAAMFGEQGEWEKQALSLANIGVALFETGRLRDAIATFNRVLEILPDDEPTEVHASTLDNRAQAHYDLGHYEHALADFRLALGINEGLGELMGQGRSLSGIAGVYYSLGDLELAREYFDRALVYRTQTKDGRGQVATSRNLGDVERQLGNLEHAEKLHRMSSALSRNPKERAKANVALARDQLYADRPRESIASLDEAIRLAEHIGLERLTASALLERGHAWTALGQFERASRDLDEALAIYGRLGLADGQASALFMLATVSAAEHQWPAAARLTRQSIDLIETLREQVPFPELRATYLSQRRAPYDFLVDLIMREAERAPDAMRDGFVEQAIAASELARSRRLVDLINEVALDVARGSDPRLLARQQTLYEQLSEARYRRDQALDAGRGDSVNSGSVLSDEMRRIETDIQLLEAELRRTNERFAVLTSPDTLDADGMQALLDPEELLVQFSLGETRSFVWFVDQDSVRVRTLPERATVESLARSAYERLRLYQPDRRSRRERDDRLRALADMLFGADADFGAYKRLLVVADGVLQFVPFAALPMLQPDGQRRPLVTSHEITGVPSMTVLALNRQIPSADGGPTKTLAVFADPVFTTDDPRLPEDTTAAHNPTPAGAEMLRRSRADSRWTRLPYTSLEATRIVSLAPADQTFLAKGFAATRSAVMDNDLGAYRYLHFATHGLIDTRTPALSALALSTIDAAGHPMDGLLPARDISRLTLSADLVVLSACDTALGREIRGESLIGLTQGFFVAGADQVLASLWSVPDRGTAYLMEEFYRGLLEQDLSPAGALRRAQQVAAGDRRWADPFYWAGFILQRGR